MPRTLIANGRVVDPSQNLDKVANLLIVDGRIASIDDATPERVDVRFDAAGKIVAPGLVDLNTHLGEPGFEEDETIVTAGAAALAGGYTTIACSPLTNPPIDTEASVEFIQHKAARAGQVRIYALACVSKHGEGKELAEIGSLNSAGAVGFTDGSRPIENSELLRRALEYCLMFDKPILTHPEDTSLSRGGVMHEGTMSLILGLAGIPSESEDVMTGRDIRLCDSTKGRLHLLDISTTASVAYVRGAKKRGVRVTAGIPILNLIFTDETLRSFDPNYKVNPPLRSKGHFEACIAAVANGTIDVISTGHTPRAREKKAQELDHSPFGVISLETALSLASMHLVGRGRLTWPQLIAAMAWRPAKVLGLDRGTLRIGSEADVIVFDPSHAWTVSEETLRGKSINTPLLGHTLIGRTTAAWIAGEQRL
jgi:dihydroorotase